MLKTSNIGLQRARNYANVKQQAPTLVQQKCQILRRAIHRASPDFFGVSSSRHIVIIGGGKAGYSERVLKLIGGEYHLYRLLRGIQENDRRIIRNAINARINARAKVKFSERIVHSFGK